jgi:hypothetical protein
MSLPDDDVQLTDEWLEAAGGVLTDGCWRFARDWSDMPYDWSGNERYVWLHVPTDYAPIGDTKPKRYGRILIETHFAKPFALTQPGCIVTRGQFRDVCRVLRFRYTEPGDVA